MKRQFRIIVGLIFAIFILPAIISASTVTNWDVSVTNGFLFCDSTSKSSIHDESGLHADSGYNMALYAIDTDVHLSHNLSIENVNLDSDTVLIAGNSSNYYGLAHFKESVEMGFIGSEENNTTVCFSGSSELTSSTSQINFASSSAIDEAENIEHSVLASGFGNLGLHTSSYKLSGIPNVRCVTESSNAHLNIYDAAFSISSYFQDPIDKLPLYESEPSHSLCPFHSP
jgi:hypothetical protein